jgi:predicted metal-dependent hydrolase
LADDRLSPRAARPRATHPKLASALARLAAAPLDAPCSDDPPPALLRAIEAFNAGQFFEQHEILELLWRDTPDEIRHLYEGILQVGVGFHHLLANHNFHGAVVKLDHGIQLLAAFPEVCQGVEVGRLRRDAEEVREHLLAQGQERLERFDPRHIPRVHLVKESA